jgi:hypothetical protein
VAEKAPLGNVGVFFNGEHVICSPNMRAVIEICRQEPRHHRH